MTTIIPLLLIAGVLTLGSGCAKPDWIEQTLVTVDVTGTWVVTDGPRIELKLEQRGSKVTGSMLFPATSSLNRSPTLEGSVAGDVFRFIETSGESRQGEMTVSGDEMTQSPCRWAQRLVCVLRRVDSARPSSQ